MRHKAYIIVLLAIAACTTERQPQPAIPRIDTIDVSEVSVVLPEGPGRAEVEKSCVPCHSLRYIEMQPHMSQKAWDKIVTKMVKTYGAPVRDSVTAAAIVDYLVAIKGQQ